MMMLSPLVVSLFLPLTAHLCISPVDNVKYLVGLEVCNAASPMAPENSDTFLLDECACRPMPFASAKYIEPDNMSVAPSQHDHGHAYVHADARNHGSAVMGMATYQVNSMNMLMDMGMVAKQHDPMNTKGIGDTELRGTYKINKHLTGSLGASLPTGDIEQTFVTMKRPPHRAPCDMQPGSGTCDLKPSLTYNDLSADAKWNWGAQAMYTGHTTKNDNGWKYGDSFKVNGWLQRALGLATSWLRTAFAATAKIKGFDPEIQKLLDPDMKKGAPMPDADPNNYGGKRIDSAIGLSIKKGNFSGGIEGGIPLYQDQNGLQLKTKWFMTAGLQLMF